MLHRRRRKGERGQIIVLFTFVFVAILAFAALVVDVGLLRNNRQSLANALDAGALAGGTLLPVDGTQSGHTAAILARVNQQIQASYPGLSTSDYTITFRCLIGVDTSGQPYISRDIPAVCDPRNALGHYPPVNADFIGAGPTRSSDCDPDRGDRCNAILISGAITNQFSFGRVVGVNQGSTGVVVSAACNGPCGQPPFAPLDVVVVIDRTSSMAGDENNLRDAARSVLTSYDPNMQHVALGMLGPSTMTQSCSGSPGNVKGIPLSVGTSGIQLEGGSTGETNEAEANISISRPSGTSSGDVMLAQITFDDGSSVATINVPNGWTMVRRTDNGSLLGQAIYYKVATGSEPNSYTWGFQTGGGADYPTVAAGGIITYSGVSTSSPFDPVASSPTIGTGATGNSATLTATGVDPNTSPTKVVAFFGHEDDTSISQPSGMSEQYENRVDNTGQDLTIAADDDTQTNANATGDKVANAGSSAAWVANLVALRSRGSEYGTDTVADLSKWMIVGLTGTGGGQQVSEAYATNGILNNSSQIAKAIACFQLSSTGTNLATPMRMAHAYLEAYGRPGVKKGIIFESDGTPNYNGSSGDPNNYTCTEALDAAADAKAAGIEIFTIGFDVVGQNCPDMSKTATVALAEMATGPILGGTSCGSNGDENRDGDHFFCEPAGSDLSAVFQAAAVQLAGIRSHLINVYPAPYVTSVSPSGGPAGGTNTVTISGSGFTGATAVIFGGANGSNVTVVNDSTVTARVPAGSSGQTVDVRVSSPGGTSPIVTGDEYTYN